MFRKYWNIKQILEQYPTHRVYILIAPGGSTIHWHISEPEPEGKYAYLGGID